MKTYKCKAPAQDHWTDIEADDPELAAMVYAEEYGLEVNDIISIWGVGKYKVAWIHYEPIYNVEKVEDG